MKKPRRWPPGTQRQVDGFILDRALVADLQAQRVEIDDRIHRFERALLPLRHFLQHLVGNGRDQVRRHLGAVQFQQMGLDLAHAHAACVHADHMIVETGHAALVFGHQFRLEARQAVARDIELQRKRDVRAVVDFPAAVVNLWFQTESLERCCIGRPRFCYMR